MSAPLVSRGQIIGAINVWRAHPKVSLPNPIWISSSVWHVKPPSPSKVRDCIWKHNAAP